MNLIRNYATRLVAFKGHKAGFAGLFPPMAQAMVLAKNDNFWDVYEMEEGEWR